MTEKLNNNVVITEQSQAVPYYIEEHTVKDLHVYLSDIIGDPSLFVDVVHQIRKLGPNDTLHLHINSPGGNLDSTLQIIDAMSQSEAYKVGYLESEACSAATMLFLVCDNWIISRFASMMIHNASYGSVGKSHEVSSQVEFTKSHTEDIVRTLYKDFLTEDEIEDVLKGLDIWFDSETIYERLGELASVRFLGEEEEEEEDEESDCDYEAASKTAWKNYTDYLKESKPTDKISEEIQFAFFAGFQQGRMYKTTQEEDNEQ